MHIPVLLKEVLTIIAPQNDQIFLDCTFGAGGYARALLDAANCSVLGLDQDQSVLEVARVLKTQYKEKFDFILGNFGNLEQLVRNVTPVLFDGIVFDLGVSSMQIDTPERGFSFYKAGPLDMRMDQNQSLTAATIINEYSQEQIANILWQYGDERKSRFIAKKIVERRNNQIFSNTLELAELINKLLPGHRKYGIHPATRTFQALRIAVNDELNQLQKALIQAKSMIRQGGHLVVVTFHSGEDIIVKKYFRELCGINGGINRYLPEISKVEPEFKLSYKKVVIPSEDEIKANIRSRSAKLRAITRL